MHKPSQCYILIGLLLFSHLAYAVDMKYIAAFSMGPAKALRANQQTLLLAPTIQKTYTQNSIESTLLDNELFVGVQFPFRNIWLNQAGIALVTTSDANITGDVWDEALPEFNNYVYQYHVQHTHLAIKEKILLNKGWYVMPWISASIGVAWNASAGFQSTPLISEAVMTPNYHNHTQSAFTYTVGIGVSRCIANHWQAGVGYEFADWGNYYLGRANGQTAGQGPGANHLYTNTLFFNLTYIN